VESIRLEKIFSSNARPMLIRLNPGAEQSTLMIFKRGDDLRQDFAVQTMFFIFNRLWALSSIPDKPFIHQYKYVFFCPREVVYFFLRRGLRFFFGFQGFLQYLSV
jgi:hypothetical protein